MWQVFLMYALFGSIFSVGKIAVEASQPYFFTGVRMLLAGALIIGYQVYKEPKEVVFPHKYWKLFLGVSFFNVFITNAFEFWGLQYMSAGKTCLIYSLSPFAAALIGYFSGAEHLTLRKWMGLGIGIFSFLPMMVVPWLEDEHRGASAAELLAEGALVVSAVTAVLGWMLVRQLTVTHSIPPLSVNGWSFICAGLMGLVASSVLEEWNPIPVSRWNDFTWTLFYIVAVHNIICYNIYASSLRAFSVTFMAFSGLSNPLFAAAFAWAFLHEDVSFPFWLAMFGVSLGLYLYYQEETSSAATTEF